MAVDINVYVRKPGKIKIKNSKKKVKYQQYSMARM